MQYFVPQMQTKTLNEGWASYWHSRILREMDLSDSEYTEFAQLHSSVLSPQRMRINPYYLGYKLLEDIEHRWDNPSEEDQAKRGMKPGQGRAKLFQLREEENDVSFLRNYLTKELVEELDLYIYKKVGDEWVIVEKDWEKVRDIIVANMTNFGYPYLTVDNGDFNHNSELLIRHHFEGQEMDLPYAEKTLEYMHLIWGRPVHLETVFEGKRLRMSYNGEKHDKKLLDRADKGERGDRVGRG
jgi:stage V sporulation protein R